MLPGPSPVVLALGLLLLAATMTVLGEAVRMVAARWVAAWRELEALERLLLDLYLGGAAVYALAVLPLGLFDGPLLLGLGALALAGIVARAGLRRRRGIRPSGYSLVRPLLGVPVLLTLAAALGLLVFEVSLAVPVGTGNTFDSSLLTLYTARLLDAHQLPLSFLPYANVGMLYPQGTTAWLGTAQLLLGLPGARTSLLVAPLFFALAPVGGYVLGRRLFASARAGLAFALTLALLGSWTRVLVGGSNDFLTAFPLVLLLAGQLSVWARELPTTGEAVGVGVLLGYSAALNPVGAEWLFPTVLLAALFANPRFAGAGLRWLGRWATALAGALVVLAPTWFILAQGIHSPGFVPGSGALPGGARGGISEPQFVGLVDPYLFRPDDIWLSPVPALRLELALLLTLGVGILVVAHRSPLARYLGAFRTFFLASFGVLLALLGAELAASTGWAPAVAVTHLTSAAELSITLFVWYGFVAAIPLVLTLEWLALRLRAPAGRPGPAPAVRLRRPAPSPGRSAALLPLAVAVLIVAPAATFTVTQLGSPLTQLYDDFGNVTADDFAMLSYLGSHLPAGARLLVAPGSAAQFVPAYAPDLVLLYPMVPGWPGINASYALVVSELTNGTLDAGGVSAIHALHAQYIAVTGASTTLWPPFRPGPLLADPAGFPVLFDSGAAYVFGVT